MKDSGIFINQIGYLISDSKIAYLTEKAKGDNSTFELCDKSSGSVVYSGNITQACDGHIDPAADEPIYTADFSSFDHPGTYFIRVNKNQSYDFKIDQQVYDQIYFSTLDYFKQSRCGEGKCHTGKAVVYGTKEKVDVQGGWHDAGDYGRYIVAGAKTVMDLLLAYKAAGNHNSSFDILSEVRFELEWMLQMQRIDGAVYHKISCYHFCGFIMPEDEKDELVLAPVSTTATADFAGTLAYAAGFFQDCDKAFAEKLINAAEKAKNYFENHDDEIYINPPEITTGGYGDKNVTDEKYFAYCSLWAATGNKDYLQKAVEIRKNNEWYDGFSWGLVSGYGTEILISNQEKAGSEFDDFFEELKTAVIAQARDILKVSESSAFKTDCKYFGWGSNGAVCDQAHTMLLAYSLTGEDAFFKAAKAQIDYLLGCNPLNICYVTGEGTKSPLHPHHRPSGASGNVLRGMLAGGPSAGLQDQYAKKHLTGLSPLKCYADALESYSTNEVAIYWNSTFVYVLSVVLSQPTR